MAAHTIFDYATPYDIMVGRWSGMTTTFDAKGGYVDSVASFVSVYWKKPHRLLHYEQQELANLDEVLKDNPHKDTVGKIVSHDFDLEIDGKACSSAGTGGEKVSLVGTETRPGIYIFHLAFPEGHYYNNQYFTNPNERHIIGPFVATPPAQSASSRRNTPTQQPGEVTFVVAQTFTRISYDVPAKLKRLLRKR